MNENNEINQRLSLRYWEVVDIPNKLNIQLNRIMYKNLTSKTDQLIQK